MGRSVNANALSLRYFSLRRRLHALRPCWRARRARKHGASAWSFRRKLKYLSDSAFAFTDLPVRLLTLVGGAGVLFALALGAVVLAFRLTGRIDVPGYTATMLVVLLVGAANLLGLGIVGGYVWRGFENTKRRPLYVEMSRARYARAGEAPPA